MIVAVRQALDYQQHGAAVAVCVLGWVLAIAIAVVLGRAVRTDGVVRSRN